jgi:hypothetical protein
MDWLVSMFYVDTEASHSIATNIRVIINILGVEYGWGGWWGRFWQNIGLFLDI